MALITTIAELRSILPKLLSSLSETAEMPNIAKAQRKYIRPLLGKAFISDLQDKYDDLNLGNDEELLKIIQLPLAAYTLLDDLSFMQSTITDAGIRTFATETMQAPHKWEYNELKQSLQDVALDGVEQLLEYLYDNQDDYPLWTDSDEFKAGNKFLITTGTDFSKYYTLYSPLYTYWALRPIMNDVDENYLASTLGRDLLSWVKTQDKIEIMDGGIVDVKILLKKAMSFLTIKHACEHASVSFNNNAFTVLASGGEKENPSSDGKTSASDLSLERKKSAADRDGQNYLAKAANYLVEIANGQYEPAFGDDFTTAFDNSPLKKTPHDRPYSNGNERRKFFR